MNGFNIKAIETQYKGYRFRSRLEARWAVFFDALGVKWEYEPEGYDLGEHGWYLPDFWLPELKLWYEVKGVLTFTKQTGWATIDYLSSPELKKLEYFADFSGWPTACAVGQVGDETIHFFAWDVTDGSGGSYYEDNAEWCNSNGIVTLDVKPGRSDRSFISDNLMGIDMPWFEYSRDYGATRHLIWDAVAAARSARFEHSERA